jgi:hypothetical protein
MYLFNFSSILFFFISKSATASELDWNSNLRGAVNKNNFF